MSAHPFGVTALVRLIGEHRSAPAIDALVAVAREPPACTPDRQNGADDEFVEFKADGVGLYFEADRLLAIYLYRSGYALGYAGYQHLLPEGVIFGHALNDVLRLLGPPYESGGGHDSFFGNVPSWLKYRHTGYDSHYTFDAYGVGMVGLLQVRSS